MKISKNMLLDLGVGVGLFVLQLIPIWWLQPNPGDFVPVRTITGIYQFDGGGSPAARASTRVADVELFCSLGFWGPHSACPQRLKNKTVTVTTASYRYMFGFGEVVTKIIDKDGENLSYTDRELSEFWTSASLREAVFMALLGSIIFNFSRKIWLLKRGDKNGK